MPQPPPPAADESARRDGSPPAAPGRDTPPDKSDSFLIAAPGFSLPKGGGAIRGIGEKFAVNPATGTGSLSVPVAASPGRSGFGPQLALSYDSGAGGGPFGLGWNLPLPAITRKTDKGLPQYLDEEDSDVFLLSGTEDLVPVLVRGADGTWSPETVAPRVMDGKTYEIRPYRPRIEGLFARIERWSNRSDPGDTFWRSISRDNITTLYGLDPESRIVGPEEDGRPIFSWLICRSFDDRGNVIAYVYKRENDRGIGVLANEQNRRHDATLYPKRIKYGNRPPYLLAGDRPVPPLPASDDDWMFEVVFDYGEHADDRRQEPAVETWPPRPDPSSSYRSGFEVRTHRLCRRILMFHHFPDKPEVGRDCLVRSTDLAYEGDPEHGPAKGMFLRSVTQTAYRRNDPAPGYRTASLPPVEFEYSTAKVDVVVREVGAESLENLPYGVDGGRYRWVDLDGEGLTGVLTEQADAWFYKPNRSANRPGPGAVHLGPTRLVASKPSMTLGRGAQLLDLAGDGDLDLVRFDGPVRGFFEHDDGQTWSNFRAFRSCPSLDVDGPNARLVDLDGDGHADLMITENDAIVWYPSLGEDGFGPARRVSKSSDEERGPHLVFADGKQSIFLADMSGDGLTDLVRVRQGDVSYWPNLGHGRFGARIAMDGPPAPFDRPECFDPRRVRLADIDGTGTTDLLYFGARGVNLYFNLSGNGWTEAQPLVNFPHVEDVSTLATVDLLGNGTACVVWSSPLPADAHRPMLYVDLMGGRKPYLLEKLVNNLGAETVVRYAASTKFYLDDLDAGRPWITRLPFPVHVVERVETIDRIGRNRFLRTYKYHHGYFDGVEREFRGFGLVEQSDTEQLATLTESGLLPDPSNESAASHVPPVLIKTWYHTGAFAKDAAISRGFEHEYWREDDPALGPAGAGLTDDQLGAMRLPDTVLPVAIFKPDGDRVPYDLTPDEQREACRALKGSLLRQEVFALDGGPESARPYSVSERNYTVEILQPQGGNPHAVFSSHPRELIDFHYERKLDKVGGRSLADPRVSHAITLKVDAVGNVLQSVAVGYGRRRDDPDPLLTVADRAAQSETAITLTENRLTPDAIADDLHRLRGPSESTTWQIHRANPASRLADVTNRFRFGEIEAIVDQLGDGRHDLEYGDRSAAKVIDDRPHRRPIEVVRTLYYRDDLSGPKPLHEFNARGLVYESYKLAFPKGWPDAVYQRAGNPLIADQVLGGDGAYLSGDEAKGLNRFPAADPAGQWWISSGQTLYSPVAKVPKPPRPPVAPAQDADFARGHFFLPQATRTPFGAVSRRTYDADNLLPIQAEDARGNLTRVDNDYRTLQAIRITDPNENRAEVALDTLGLVVGTAIRGKASEFKGDTLDGFEPDLDTATILAHMDAPLSNPGALLKRATSRIVYDLFAYRRTRDSLQPRPNAASVLVRETHDADVGDGPPTAILISLGYSDGFGREIQRKIQAEPGPLVPGRADESPRWVGSGWMIFNNKGQPVRKYEPFFSRLPAADRHRFEFARIEGVSPILFYDPPGRVVATLHPNHLYEKVVFDPWRQETWDACDTVALNPKADADVSGFFKRLPDADYLPIWRDQRGPSGPLVAEHDTAEKAAAHADTPTFGYLDSLGRTFLTVEQNRFDRGGQTIRETYATRTRRDIEGNTLEVQDARDRVVMRYEYDMLGQRLRQESMEAGARWLLNDALGMPIRSWDSRDHAFRTEYDDLRRPTRLFVQGHDPAHPADEACFQQFTYGEDLPDPADARLRNCFGKIYQLRDTAGIVTSGEYDFKGNLLRSSRILLKDYRAVPDWRAEQVVEPEAYEGQMRFDALNRPIQVIPPRSGGPVHCIQPTYNVGGLLERIDLWHGRTTVPTVRLDSGTADQHPVTNIDHDAKGLRTRIDHGNGVQTSYDYDPLTFRLVRIQTRGAAGTYQDLTYQYDPVGNVTTMRDAAQSPLYFANALVSPVNDYRYDAIYRLIEAAGREHIGQAGVATPPTWDDAPRSGLPHRQDPSAMRNYTERYEYDAVGNFARTVHEAGAQGTWTRDYFYEVASLLGGGPSNILSRTVVGGAAETYLHDPHGNMTSMPHLDRMEWDFKDQLRLTARQAVNDSPPPARSAETTYYVYDASGVRIRKVTERQGGSRKGERIYLGGSEIFRDYRPSGEVKTARETLHVMDDQHRVALVELTTVDAGAPLPAARRLVRYQFANHLGSAVVELDEDATVVSYEEYYPYGGTSFQEVNAAVQAAAKRYRFTARERDEETGLYYHGARYYAPWLGRWASCDPSGMVDGTDLYVYVRNNPIHMVDPSGHRGHRPADADCTNRAGPGLNPTRAGADFENPQLKASVSAGILKDIKDQLANQSQLPRGLASPSISLGTLTAGSQGNVGPVKDIGKLPYLPKLTDIPPPTGLPPVGPLQFSPAPSIEPTRKPTDYENYQKDLAAPGTPGSPQASSDPAQKAGKASDVLDAVTSPKLTDSGQALKDLGHEGTKSLKNDIPGVVAGVAAGAGIIGAATAVAVATDKPAINTAQPGGPPAPPATPSIGDTTGTQAVLGGVNPALGAALTAGLNQLGESLGKPDPNFLAKMLEKAEIKVSIYSNLTAVNRPASAARRSVAATPPGALSVPTPPPAAPDTKLPDNPYSGFPAYPEEQGRGFSFSIKFSF